MNISSIIKQFETLLSDQQYNVIVGNINETSHLIKSLPTAIIEIPATTEWKSNEPGYISRKLNILLLDVENSQPQTLEETMIDICNKIVGEYSIAEINIEKMDTNRGKYSPLNEISLNTQIKIISIY